MTWSDSPEVAVVERCQLGLSETLNDRDDGRVDESELQVGVPCEQFLHPHVVITHEVNDRNGSIYEIRKEGRERLWAEPVAGKPVQLDDHRSGHDQRLDRAGKKVRAKLVVGVGPVHRCVERTGVADQRHERGS